MSRLPSCLRFSQELEESKCKTARQDTDVLPPVHLWNTPDFKQQRCKEKAADCWKPLCAVTAPCFVRGSMHMCRPGNSNIINLPGCEHIDLNNADMFMLIIPKPTNLEKRVI